MVKVGELDFRRIGSFKYGANGTDAIGYSDPQMWSSRMKIGLVGIAPNEQGADQMGQGLARLQAWFYSVPDRYTQSLKTGEKPEARLEAVRAISDFGMPLPGKAFFMVYFVGGRDDKTNVYEIPLSIVLASGHDPEQFKHHVLLYLAGEPAVAVSRVSKVGLPGQLAEAEYLARLDGILRREYQEPLSSLAISIGGNEEGVVMPVIGLTPKKEQESLEAIARTSR